MSKTVKIDIWYPKNILDIIESGREPQVYCATPPIVDKGFVKTQIEVEAKPKKITITEAEFDEACSKTWSCTDIRSLKLLKKAIGFKDD